MKRLTQTKAQESETGIDVDQLLFNLSLSYELRITHHQAALDLIWELENARRLNETESQCVDSALDCFEESSWTAERYFGGPRDRRDRPSYVSTLRQKNPKLEMVNLDPDYDIIGNNILLRT